MRALPGWWTTLAFAFVTLLAAHGGTALAATCAVVPGASEFAIEDVGKVVFEELATDRAADAIRFGGGVCLEVAGQTLTIRAEVLDVSGLGVAPVVSASMATVRAGPWVLGADELRATAEAVTLTRATLSGEGLVGLADVLELSIADGVFQAQRLVVATPTLRLDMGVGRFDGREIHGERLVLSTCDCAPGDASLRLEGLSGVYDLDTNMLRLEQGALVAFGMRFAVEGTIALDEDILAEFTPPLALERDQRRGWLLQLVEQTQGGVRLSADWAFSDERPPRARSLLSASEGATHVTLRLTSGSAEVLTATSLPLGAGFTLGLTQRLSGGTEEPVQDAALRLSYGPDRALPALPAGSIAARAEGTLALSAQQLGGITRASPRAVAAARLDAASPPSELGVLRVRTELGVSGYATLPGEQLWWSVNPRYDLRRPSASVSMSHLYRDVLGSSPFDEEVDEVLPRQRSEVTLALHPQHERWRASLAARYDWLPDAGRPGRSVGLERLRLDARVIALEAAGAAPELAFAGALELAGWLDPRANRDGFARLSADVSWPRRKLELGLAAEVALLPDQVGLRELTIGGSFPLTWSERELEVRPYLALDVWPTLAGDGWPLLRGHGLGLLWRSPYGTLDAAYRSEPDGSFTSALAIRVEPREPRLQDLRR